jgi:SAM-dependent methyltransferase
MAINLNSARFLLNARKQGVSFQNTLTLGRQSLDLLPRLLKVLVEKYGLPSSQLIAELEKTGIPRFSEPFFRLLGAKEVCSIDVSSYQDTSIVHDMNLPIPDSLKNRFDIVYDGGTLEHVFNFPVALKNAMQMVKPGGRFIMHTPGNNWFGHGFYQFSPEMLYRALSEENGYQVERMIAHAFGQYGRWYQVADPEKVHCRVELVTLLPILLLIQAKRTRETEIFARPPQQSDYAVLWQRTKPALASPKSASDGFLRTRLPRLALMLRTFRTGWQFFRDHSLRNRRCFTPIARD